jgi:hypothetical protein
MKNFTEDDVQTVKPYGDDRSYLKISADRDDLIDAPMWFHKKGLSETSTGYGKRLNSGYKISFNGKLYRVYVTIFSNSGTMWFTCKGRKIIVS